MRWTANNVAVVSRYTLWNRVRIERPSRPADPVNADVVMYHFVRDLRGQRFPEIKGLTVEEFRGQVRYIRRHYNVIGWTELLAALAVADRPLPPRALLLTFDDGYRDHFDNVFPFWSRTA